MTATSFDPTTTPSAHPDHGRTTEPDPTQRVEVATVAGSAAEPDPDTSPVSRTLTRASAWFGVVFAVSQLSVMIVMATLVLPKGGSLGDPADVRGQNMLDAQTFYRVGNYVFILAGGMLLGFVGAVRAHLMRADRSGILATAAVGAGTLLAVLWPLGGLLHDVALDIANAGTDPRILAGWDSVAPYSLAFSVLPRVFFIGAIVIGLRMSGTAAWLQRIGIVLIPVSLVGSATLVSGAVFPLLAVSTLGYELWVGALAWHWLRTTR